MEKTKMKELDELQKALAEVEAIIWAVCEPNSLGRVKQDKLTTLFTRFKAEYEGQLHVVRKELEEWKERIKNHEPLADGINRFLEIEYCKGQLSILNHILGISIVALVEGTAE